MSASDVVQKVPGMSAGIIINVMPVWARISVCTALTGIPDNRIRALYNCGKVRAKKIEPEEPNSACVFRVQDCLDWLDEEAKNPKKFSLKQESQAQKVNSNP